MTRHHRTRPLSAAATKTSKPATSQPASGGKPKLRAGILFGVCLLAYLATGQSEPGNDAASNVHLPLQLLEHGSVFFTPEENPRMFRFAVDTPEGRKGTRIRDWRITYQGQTVRDAYAKGLIGVDRPMYYLVPTRHPGKYASTFGLGAGLWALPVVAPVRAVVSDLASNLDLLWWLGKLAAALSVAGAVAFLYFAALRASSPGAAVLVALAYGLGTCVFSISSQALWQHGPCEFFLAMGAYHLLSKAGKRSDLLCGLGFALAVFCRPTSAIVVVCVGGYLLISDRRRLLWFVVGGLPVAVALFGYSQYTFGSLFSFGQLGAGAGVAQVKTGNPGLWQTPLWLGMAGLLVSPARGLFVYTPIALFAAWGVGRAFRDPAWKDLRPLAAAALLLLGLASKWFDWWGGWCFGYRPIVDLAILLAFLSLPVLGRVASSKVLKRVFAGLFAYSVGVQVLGAVAYDVTGWNNRKVWEVVAPDRTERLSFPDRPTAELFVRDRDGQLETRALNVDMPEYRQRLWSIVDSPIVYYLSNLSSAIESRGKGVSRFIADEG